MWGGYGRAPGMAKSKLCTAGAGTCVLPAPKAGRDRLETQAGGSPRAQPQQGTVSVFHTLCQIKAFLCPEYLQTDVSNTPELCRLLSLCSWKEQAPPGQLNTTDPLGSLCKAELLLQHLSTPGKHLPFPGAPTTGQLIDLSSRRAHRGCCHPPHGPWPQTRRPGSLGKHKPALQCDPNLVTHIWAPHSKVNLRFKGSKETPENRVESTSTFPDLLL